MKEKKRYDETGRAAYQESRAAESKEQKEERLARENELKYHLRRNPKSSLSARREYRNQPEQKTKTKEYQNQYQNRPEQKDYQKEYRNRPEQKDYQKEYRNRKRACSAPPLFWKMTARP